jgi:hypothetical protein
MSILSIPKEQRDRELAEMLKKVKTYKMSKQEREEQLVSLVWGNAPDGSTSTIEDVRAHLNLD